MNPCPHCDSKATMVMGTDGWWCLNCDRSIPPPAEDGDE